MPDTKLLPWLSANLRKGMVPSSIVLSTTSPIYQATLHLVLRLCFILSIVAIVSAFVGGSGEAWRAWLRLLGAEIAGCSSDPPGLSFITTAFKPAGNKLLMQIRVLPLSPAAQNQG